MYINKDKLKKIIATGMVVVCCSLPVNGEARALFSNDLSTETNEYYFDLTNDMAFNNSNEINAFINNRGLYGNANFINFHDNINNNTIDYEVLKHFCNLRNNIVNIMYNTRDVNKTKKALGEFYSFYIDYVFNGASLNVKYNGNKTTSLYKNLTKETKYYINRLGLGVCEINFLEFKKNGRSYSDYRGMVQNNAINTMDEFYSLITAKKISEQKSAELARKNSLNNNYNNNNNSNNNNQSSGDVEIDLVSLNWLDISEYINGRNTRSNNGTMIHLESYHRTGDDYWILEALCFYRNEIVKKVFSRDLINNVKNDLNYFYNEYIEFVVFGGSCNLNIHDGGENFYYFEDMEYESQLAVLKLGLYMLDIKYNDYSFNGKNLSYYREIVEDKYVNLVSGYSR